MSAFDRDFKFGDMKTWMAKLSGWGIRCPGSLEWGEGVMQFMQISFVAGI